MKTIRQGDLLFIPTDETIPEHSTKLEDGVIALGEATGHHHRLETLEDAEVFRVDWRGGKMVRVGPKGVSVVHEEHGPQRLAPGNYKVHIAREFDYVSQLSRYVND